MPGPSLPRAWHFSIYPSSTIGPGGSFGGLGRERPSPQAAFFNHFLRYETQGQDHQDGDDNQVIEVPDDGQEIRDQVER